MITQKDIAKSLGISQPAVGAVLGRHSENSSTHVGPKLRDRILMRAKEFGYRPNMFAQGMRGQSTGVIGALHFSSFLQSSIQREIHMAQAIAARGHKLVTTDAIASSLNHASGDESFRLLVDQMIDFRVDGVILSSVPGLMPAEEIARLTGSGIPCVSMSGIPFPGVPFVGPDFQQGVEILTQHVIRQGHRHLVMIVQELFTDSRNPTSLSINPRLKGYSAAVEREGGRVVFLNELEDSGKPGIRQVLTGESGPTGWVFSAPGSMNVEDTYIMGYQAVNKLLDAGISADVILLPNDNWLQGALLALKERCIPVPDEVGLTGFDASPFGQYGSLPFTTVAQPHEKIASKAVEILFSLMEGEPPPDPMVVRLPCSMVPGATTAPRKS